MQLLVDSCPRKTKGPNLEPKIILGDSTDLIEEKGPLARHLECATTQLETARKAPKMRLKVTRLSPDGARPTHGPTGSRGARVAIRRIARAISVDYPAPGEIDEPSTS
jgi:hypothetical protein